jgi:ribosome-binding factor A
MVGEVECSHSLHAVDVSRQAAAQHDSKQASCVNILQASEGQVRSTLGNAAPLAPCG